MNRKSFNRRKFLKAGSLTALGAGLVPGIGIAGDEKKQSLSEVRIKEHRKFGRTGFEVSDISSGNPSNEAVLKALLLKGVNLIDTGEVYSNGNSEILIGKVIKDFDRSSIFINSKLYTEKQFTSKQDVIDRTNRCLERLQTDYIDCMQIHSADNTAILKDEAFHSAMEQLKMEGKVRHLGVSCHGANWAFDTEESLDKILLSAIDDGRFDVLLLAYNFINAEIAEKVLNACEQKNIATIIMKSNPVQIYGSLSDRIVKLTEEGEEIDKYTQAFYDKYKIMNDEALDFFSKYQITGENEIMEAASKFVLSNTKAHTTIWDFRNFDDLNNMLRLSGEKLTKKDKLVLDGFRKNYGHLSCRVGCNQCEPACPHQLPVNKILRYNYYFSVKKREKFAIGKFARLASQKPAKVCVDCEAYCEKACPFGVSTRSLLAMAQQNMELIS